MARFYGTIRGQRGMATRLGHTSITTQAASYQGAIEVTLTPQDNSTNAHVRMIPWKGAGESRVLYDGPVDQPVARQRQYVVRVVRSPVDFDMIGPFESHADAVAWVKTDDLVIRRDWYIEPLTVPSLVVRQDISK